MTPNERKLLLAIADVLVTTGHRSGCENHEDCPLQYAGFDDFGGRLTGQPTTCDIEDLAKEVKQEAGHA